jgi:hypothetical protein
MSPNVKFESETSDTEDSSDEDSDDDDNDDEDSGDEEVKVTLFEKQQTHNGGSIASAVDFLPRQNDLWRGSTQTQAPNRTTFL